MSTPSAEYGIALVAAPPLKVIVCEAAEGKLLDVRYKTADGRTVALPPCVSFEIVNIDQDGRSLVPNMLDATPRTRFYSRTPDAGYGAFAEHDTAEDAQATAKGALEPDGEWPEDIESTQWGMLIPIERVRQIDYEETSDGEFDYTCGYELVGAA